MAQQRTKIAPAALDGNAHQIDKHHGDLRKGTFLKRRAVYRSQTAARTGPAGRADPGDTD